MSTLSPILTRRVRPGNVIAAGLAVQVVGYLMLTQAGSASGLPLLIAGFAVLYPAVAPSMALTTDLVVSSVLPERAGAASGLSTTASDGRGRDRRRCRGPRRDPVAPCAADRQRHRGEPATAGAAAGVGSTIIGGTEFLKTC